jgi:hypothetical protein
MDKRTWFIAIVGTLALLGIGGLMCLAPVSEALKYIPIRAGGAVLSEIIYVAAWTAALFVMPGVLTIIAKRVPFLWGAMPAFIVLIVDLMYVIWRDVHNLKEFGALLHSFADLSYFSQVPLTALVLGWVFSSGIGLLVRRVIRGRALKNPSAFHRE